MDDACIIFPSEHRIEEDITSLQRDYNLTDDVELQDYIGTRFERRSDGSVLLTVPRMIDRLLSIVGLSPTDTRVKVYDTPIKGILHTLPDAKPHS